MNFLKILEIEDINYLNFLSKMTFEKGLVSNVQEYYNEFHCKIGDNGRTETFQDFFISGMESELAYFYIKEICKEYPNEKDYLEEVLIDFYINYQDSRLFLFNKTLKKQKEISDKELISILKQDLQEAIEDFFFFEIFEKYKKYLTGFDLYDSKNILMMSKVLSLYAREMSKEDFNKLSSLFYRHAYIALRDINFLIKNNGTDCDKIKKKEILDRIKDFELNSSSETQDYYKTLENFLKERA
jgi:hypothetical protein